MRPPRSWNGSHGWCCHLRLSPEGQAAQEDLPLPEAPAALVALVARAALVARDHPFSPPARRGQNHL